MELEREELEKLYANTFKGLKEGSIVKGMIVQIFHDGIMVDVGYKCEGLVQKNEFSDEEYNSLHEGDSIDVFIMKIKESEGIVQVSRKKAELEKKWTLIEEAYEKGNPLEGKVIEAVKGGLMVDIMGLRAFLPGSQIDTKATKDMEKLIDQVLPIRIIKINQKRSNIIVSRRMILEEERQKQREATLINLEEGAICEGTVKNITDYGAFIDLGGADGLLHISDMSWGRISHPKQLFNIGDKVEVIVLKYDKETEKITLGYKQKRPDPWSFAEEKYSTGTKVTGKIINIADYGVFVEIEEGLEGLIHVSEMEWLEKIKKPSKFFSIGDIVDSVVLSVDKEERKISLSIKQLKPNPWDIVNEKYKIGQKIQGKVRSFTDFGAFITIEEGIDALLHISDMSWTRHIRHPSEMLKRGQTIDAVVLSIDPEKERMALGLKQLTSDLWLEEIPSKYKIGDSIKGKIVKIADFGLFVAFNDGDIEGLVYASEIDLDPSKSLDSLFKVGDEITATIIKVDSNERKIGLSMKYNKINQE